MTLASEGYEDVDKWAGRQVVETVSSSPQRLARRQLAALHAGKPIRQRHYADGKLPLNGREPTF